MSKVQLQFHAGPDEVLVLATQWSQEFGLVLVIEQFFPDYEAKVRDGSGTDDSQAGLGTINRIALCNHETPDLSATTAHEFVTRNTNCSYLSIGPASDIGLRESALGGATNDKETLRVWRSITRQAKKKMHRGATARNPAFGAARRVPNHLHTLGAHRLAEKGVVMLAVAGWVEFEFDDVEQRQPSEVRCD